MSTAGTITGVRLKLRIAEWNGKVNRDVRMWILKIWQPEIEQVRREVKAPVGTFTVQIAIGDQERGRWTTFDALVDTGASITSVPASVLRDLNVQPLAKRRFRFGQGEIRTMDVGQAWVRIEGEEIVTLVLFNEEGTTPLLGALALEGVFMGVDPVGQKLVPVEGLMM